MAPSPVPSVESSQPQISQVPQSTLMQPVAPPVSLSFPPVAMVVDQGAPVADQTAGMSPQGQ